MCQHHVKKKTSMPSRFQHNLLKFIHSVLHPFLSHFPALLEDMLHAAYASAKQRRGHSEWVQKDDIFVVDRGFRDSLDYLEQMGIKGKIPSFLAKGDKQMSTENANTSRFVTKAVTDRTRLYLEPYNNRMKIVCKSCSNRNKPCLTEYIRALFVHTRATFESKSYQLIPRHGWSSILVPVNPCITEYTVLEPCAQPCSV
uniref:Uncharacterized protein n=1 Tax=Magallana gigas TaxID=29159 RepID=K1S712_MAGGI